MDFDFKPRKQKDLNISKINQEVDRFDFVSNLNKYSKILTFFWIPYLCLIVAAIVSYGFVLAKSDQHIISGPWIAFYIFLAVCILFSIVSLFLEIMLLIFSIKYKTNRKQYLILTVCNLVAPLIFSWLILNKSHSEMKKIKWKIQKDFLS